MQEQKYRGFESISNPFCLISKAQNGYVPNYFGTESRRWNLLVMGMGKGIAFCTVKMESGGKHGEELINFQFAIPVKKFGDK